MLTGIGRADSKMKPEAQRIAIAEACGWTKVNPLDYGSAVVGLPPKHKYVTLEEIPDYLCDLNAMHEVEEKMNPLLIFTYLKFLGYPGAFFPVVYATAAQRAEAFLRTKGLWVE
jgi:hypothetical protein